MPILCLEANWNGKRPSSQSVESTLETLCGIHQDSAVHLWCNTMEELTYSLRDMTYGFRQGTLYLSFHGLKDSILLASGQRVGMKALADLMGNRFAGWNIHFGSCNTMKSENAPWFKKTTGARILSGYITSVGWVQSMSTDLLFLSEAYRYVRPSHLKKRMLFLYPDLIKLTGLVIL